MSESFYCYLITSDNNRTYIGITNDLTKRLDMHNKKLKGGAKSTSSGTNWKYHLVVGQFDKKDAMRFEWYWKHQHDGQKWIKTKSGLDNKKMRLTELLSVWINKDIKIMPLMA